MSEANKSLSLFTKLIINFCKVPSQEKKNGKRTSQLLNETQAAGKEQKVEHFTTRPCRVAMGFLMEQAIGPWKQHFLSPFQVIPIRYGRTDGSNA